jgi:uncharacterized membrane protein YvlD (DUF360 family)
MFFLLTIVATGVVLLLVAAVTSNLEIDDVGAAFKPGLAIAVAGFAFDYLLMLAPEGSSGFAPFGGFWAYVAFEFAFNTVVLGLSVVMTSGVRFNGWGTFLITSLLVNLVIVLGPYGLAMSGLGW